MNLLNVFWGFIAFFIALIIDTILIPLVETFISFFSTYPTVQTILYLSEYTFIIILTFALPIAIVFSDDAATKVTKLVKGGIGG